MTEKDINTIIAIFDKHAEQYAERYADMSAYSEAIWHFMDHPAPNPKILDIACGPGNLLGLILEDIEDAEVTGIDLSTSMLDIARSRFPQGRFLELDMRDINELGDKFDRISCGFGLPYISLEELDTWISNVYKRLASKGRVYLSTMVKKEASTQLVLPSSGKGKGVNTSYYTQDLLVNNLEKCGFDIEFQAFFKTDSPELQDYVVVASK